MPEYELERNPVRPVLLSLSFFSLRPRSLSSLPRDNESEDRPPIIELRDIRENELLGLGRLMLSVVGDLLSPTLDCLEVLLLSAFCESRSSLVSGP